MVIVKPGFVRTPMSAGNRFSMPFLVEADEAARIILKGVMRNRRTIRFPWPMACIASLYNRLPGPLYDRLTRVMMPSGR